MTRIRITESDRPTACLPRHWKCIPGALGARYARGIAVCETREKREEDAPRARVRVRREGIRQRFIISRVRRVRRRFLSLVRRFMAVSSSKRLETGWRKRLEVGQTCRRGNSPRSLFKFPAVKSHPKREGKLPVVEISRQSGLRG